MTGRCVLPLGSGPRFAMPRNDEPEW